MPDRRGNEVTTRPRQNLSIYSNPPMKTLILVKRLRLRHVLVRLPCLLSTFPLHKQFQAAVIQPPIATDLLCRELFLLAVVGNHWGERPRVIRPLLLAQSPALTELYLRFSGRKVAYATVSGIWELHLPQLAVLSLQNAGLSRTTFCSFLDRHVHLRELTLTFMAETSGLWYRVFTSIRNHPGLEDLRIFGLNKKLQEPLSTFHQSELSSSRTRELYNYLHGNGEWTAALSRYWGHL